MHLHHAMLIFITLAVHSWGPVGEGSRDEGMEHVPSIDGDLLKGLGAGWG